MHFFLLLETVLKYSFFEVNSPLLLHSYVSKVIFIMLGMNISLFHVVIMTKISGENSENLSKHSKAI